MNDRELLELAAKAAGIEVHTIEDADGVVHWDGWNPLTDDGDALRLAVKLRLEVLWWKDALTVQTDDGKASSGIVKRGTDPYAATRRAIVRAAAAIAKAEGA